MALGESSLHTLVRLKQSHPLGKDLQAGIGIRKDNRRVEKRSPCSVRRQSAKNFPGPILKEGGPLLYQNHFADLDRRPRGFHSNHGVMVAVGVKKFHCSFSHGGTR